MNELARTGVYLVVAGLLGTLAYSVQPTKRPLDPGAEANKSLTNKFTDISQAKSLEITRANESLAEISAFRVAEVGGRWVIPSHDNYPADAKSQLGDVAKALIDLNAMDVVSTDAKDHTEYGVLEPTAAAIKELKQGIGTLVTILNQSDEPIVRLIIGKEANTSNKSLMETVNKELRFVRIQGQDAVYVAPLPFLTISSEFEKWIDKDLLQLNAFDVAKVEIKDYSIVDAQDRNGDIVKQLSPRSETLVSFNRATSKWDLEEMTVFRGTQKEPSGLSEDEELNGTVLNDLKSAVDNLSIVDVVRKPEGLGADLQGSENLTKESRVALSAKGFYLRPETSEILGTNGDIRIIQDDGVEYVLRFGVTRNTAESASEGKLNRYMLATARFRSESIPEPTLLPEPGGQVGPAESKPESEKTDEERALEQNRDKIARENQRKKDDYNNKVKKATTKVKELNARFADWFYVINEETYRKIHLTRADIVKATDRAKEEGYGVDAFRELVRQGLSKKKTTTPPPAPPRFE